MNEILPGASTDVYKIHSDNRHLLKYSPQLSMPKPGFESKLKYTWCFYRYLKDTRKLYSFMDACITKAQALPVTSSDVYLIQSNYRIIHRCLYHPEKLQSAYNNNAKK
jgi:hypothetical protein